MKRKHFIFCLQIGLSSDYIIHTHVPWETPVYADVACALKEMGIVDGLHAHETYIRVSTVERPGAIKVTRRYDQRDSDMVAVVDSDDKMGGVIYAAAGKRHSKWRIPLCCGDQLRRALGLEEHDSIPKELWISKARKPKGWWV